MANFLRMIVGIALLPACWGFARSFFDCVVLSTGSGGSVSVEALSLLGGVLAFVLCWTLLSHPVKAYVLGHELTHALWGVLFGARPSCLRVDASGGSVRLTKTNLLVTLAPYFFPFYTFVVILAALITSAFVRPLPWLPLWMFLIGFSWSFHVLFTIETLTQRQPDVTLYGRIFSWTLIFIANLAIVLVWLATATPLSFGQLGDSLCHRLSDSYVGVFTAAVAFGRWVAGLVASAKSA